MATSRAASSCWGGGAVPRGARILSIVGAVGSVVVGLVPT